MRVLLIALLAAISYAQTDRPPAQAGQGSYPYGGNQQGGYPQNNRQTGGYPSNNRPQTGGYQGGYPPNTGGRPNGLPPNQAGPGMQGGMPQGGMPLAPTKTIMDCTQKDQEMCPRKRMKNLCDADVCCVFEYKDRVPNCYGIDDAPYSQVECKDFPRDQCDKDPSCMWSMTDYECDMKFNVRADMQEECLQNPSNPECYSKMQEAGAVSGLGCLLFCFGCCCGYFIRPCYANHEKRKSETQAASRKKSTVGEAQWDYQPAPDGGRPVDHQALGVSGHKPTRRSKTPQLDAQKRYPSPNYPQYTTSRAGESYGVHGIHFE